MDMIRTDFLLSFLADLVGGVILGLSAEEVVLSEVLAEGVSAEGELAEVGNTVISLSCPVAHHRTGLSYESRRSKVYYGKFRSGTK